MDDVLQDGEILLQAVGVIGGHDTTTAQAVEVHDGRADAKLAARPLTFCKAGNASDDHVWPQPPTITPESFNRTVCGDQKGQNVEAIERDCGGTVPAGFVLPVGGVSVEMPPLREHREHIPELVGHFLRQSALRFHVAEPIVPRRELERAQEYAGPGNVRELQNAVERAIIVSHGGKLVFDLPQGKTTAPLRPEPSHSEVIPEHEWRRREAANVMAALEQAGYRISVKGGAADLLGVNPAALTSRIKVLEIKPREARQSGR